MPRSAQKRLPTVEVPARKITISGMGYVNPVEHMGHAQFADRASTAGVDAIELNIVTSGYVTKPA